MKKIIYLILILFLAGCSEEIIDFKDCKSIGKISEGYPRQCITPDGAIFIEELQPCENRCGDGICYEMACQAKGCQCPENSITCPLDCSTVKTDIYDCGWDEECIPSPEECHPLICINQKYQEDYNKPEVCTMEFREEAAYSKEDCICLDDRCQNKNVIGKRYLHQNKTKCSMKFLCEPGEEAFFDGNGCGCQTEQKIFCRDSQRGSDFCTMELHPVCGWFDESVQCVKYPCAGEFNNPCEACKATKVKFYTEGECPK